MRKYFVFILFLNFAYNNVFAQLYFPNESYYNSEIIRLSLNDTTRTKIDREHLSFKPIIDSKTKPEVIYHTDDKRYYWITQKLFKENFLLFKGNDYWCAVDPILDFVGGNDFSADSNKILYWNTRGIRVQAKFFDRVAFTTTFYENQSVLPVYQQNYVNSHGEFIVNGGATKYTQNNAIIPGYARTKPFKVDGYDFGFAEGALSIIAAPWLNIQLGNGNQFIGNGERSLLLSDFSTNYPFAKLETSLWQNRIQYIAMYAIHQNLYRLKSSTTPEATYERKIGTYHYLDIALTKDFNVGLFESFLWKRTDSIGSHQPDWMFINPIIGGNTLIKGTSGEGYQAYLGLNANYNLQNLNIYGQLILDNFKFGGVQFGFKFYDLFVEKLDFGAEINHIQKNSFTSTDKRYNYNNNNLSLAHPNVNGIDELIISFSYQKKRVFITNKLIYSEQAYRSDDTYYNKTLLTRTTLTNDAYKRKNVLYNQFEIGYRFNKNYNLQAIIGYIYRQDTKATDMPHLSNYCYLGIRTKIRNKNLNF
ncbi:hypothetical protein [Crocinitomix catalasitica]|uniref:hypothetical protein n=1 Tax=Crocinitomix catalasitica TaxID=184607 RepID=UPI000489335E|nr:hypothetical protein [Crocinitomix catalasitica]